MPKTARLSDPPRVAPPPAGDGTSALPLSGPLESSDTAGLGERVRASADGLQPLLARAQAVQQQRAHAAKERGAPRWTDVFTTQFTEFSNRPR